MYNRPFLTALHLVMAVTIVACGSEYNLSPPPPANYGISPDTERNTPPDTTNSKGMEAAFLKRLPDLASQSTYICTAYVREIKSFATKNFVGDEFILSDVIVDVKNPIKGNPASQMTIRTVGGSLNGLRYIYSFAPDFVVGQKTLLFLKQQGDIIYPYQFQWGKYTLTTKDLLKETNLTLDTVTQLIEENIR